MVVLADSLRQPATGELVGATLYKVQAEFNLYTRPYNVTEDELELHMFALATARQCQRCSEIQEYRRTGTEERIPLEVQLGHWWGRMFSVVPAVCHRVKESACLYEPRRVLYAWSYIGTGSDETSRDLRIDEDDNLFQRNEENVWDKLDPNPELVRKLKQIAFSFMRGKKT
jgi:hypothetical protein